MGREGEGERLLRRELDGEITCSERRSLERACVLDRTLRRERHLWTEVAREMEADRDPVVSGLFLAKLEGALAESGGLAAPPSAGRTAIPAPRLTLGTGLVLAAAIALFAVSGLFGAFRGRGRATPPYTALRSLAAASRPAREPVRLHENPNPPDDLRRPIVVPY